MIAAFYGLTEIYAEHEAFTIAITQSERPSSITEDFRNVIGEFTNVKLYAATEKRNILDSAKAVYQYLMESSEHNDIDGISYIRNLREYHNNPYLAFPVVFTSFIGITNFSKELEGVQAKIAYQKTQTPQISLDYQVMEHKGNLIINWDYNTCIYEEQLIEEMLMTNIHQLEQLASGQQDQLDKLHPDVLKLRHNNNMTHEQYADANLLLHELFQKQAMNNPAEIAIIDQEVYISYLQLHNTAISIAHKLTDNGLKPGDPVPVLIGKSWKQVAAVLGILYAGGYYIPVDPKYPQHRIEKLFQLAGGTLALVDDQPLSLSSGMNVTAILCPEQPSSLSEDPVYVEAVYPDALAYIIFTSGSTGEPKGVKISHRGAVNTCISMNRKFGIDQAVTFGISALNFDLSVWDIFGTFYSGGTLVICKEEGTKDPDYWWEQIMRHNISIWNTVPTSFEMLLLAAPHSADMKLLKTVLLSGDAIKTEMIRNAKSTFRNAQIIALGGATEASIWSNYHVVQEETFHMGTHLIPYGKPLPNQTMYVLDKQYHYTPSGVIGNIYIGGVGLAVGYLNNTMLTEECFIQVPEFGRVYHTGDIGRYLPNGEIEIIGRSDAQIKILGYRIELGEIEHCLKSIEEVKQAIVVYDPEQRDLLTAFIVPHTTPDETVRKKIQLHTTRYLPDYMVPGNWHFIDSIPLTANSKVDYNYLKELSRTRGTEDKKAVVENHTGNYLAMILNAVSKLLNKPEETLSATRSLLEQGITSLYSVRLVNELRAVSGLQIPYTATFNFPSAKLLSDYLSELSDMASVAATETPVTNVVTSEKEPVAVVGMAYRLPNGIIHRGQLRDMIYGDADCISDVPASRFDINEIYDPAPGALGKSYSRRGGFMQEVDSFDHEFFGIPLSEAKVMDPQQRLLLEVAYEACMQAGYDMERLKGSNTGVFIGQMNYDWMMDFPYNRDYASSGVAPSITSNRISYVLGLNGPSMTIDTACSSSLVAVDIAVNKLHNGDCDMAIVGGINIILSPESYIFTSQARMLSPNNRCATFDAAADGIVRGEGLGVVILKRVGDAERDKNAIEALIVGTAVNQDGRSATLTAPNGLAQEKVIMKALECAGLEGHQIDFAE